MGDPPQVATADVHRVHHSIVANDTTSNFGFNLPWWDWLFGTYRSASRPVTWAWTLGVG